MTGEHGLGEYIVPVIGTGFLDILEGPPTILATGADCGCADAGVVEEC